MSTKTKTQFSFFFIFLLSIFPATFSDLSAARSALLTLRSAVGGRTLLWAPTSTTPCSFLGVHCRNDTVVGLHLPGFSLTGPIPTGIFPNLTALKTLSLRFNHLTGPIPDDISHCSQLKSINLEGNEFSGEIPDLSSLKKLVRLNLGGNELEGEIPKSLGKLRKLRTLYLEENKLSGFLPELKLELDYFNVSNNGLNGSIPVSLSSMPVESFVGNRLCGKPLQICPGIAASTGVLDGEFGRKKKGLSAGAIAGIVIAPVVAFSIVLMLIVFACGNKHKRRKNDVGIDITSITKQLGFEIPGEKPPVYTPVVPNSKVEQEAGVGGENIKKLVFFGSGIEGKVFDLEELFRASAEVLGKGTFGTAYKAVLELGPVVVVKRLRDATCSENEFKNKMEALGAMDHPNLLPIRAYYYSLDEKLLVCDYMPMGSLSAFLHGNKGAGRSPLNWETRSRIAHGIARGITHLHSHGPHFSHGNIKSSNILLTDSYTPQVSDFGLAHLVGPTTTSTTNRGNGYRAPEVTDPQRVSQKADIYSFGVLLLELLTGKAPAHALLHEEGVDLPRWAQAFIDDNRTSDVFDIELSRLSEGNMVAMLGVALECTANYPDIRPTMVDVTRRIEEICGQSSIKESR